MKKCHLAIALTLLFPMFAAAGEGLAQVKANVRRDYTCVLDRLFVSNKLDSSEASVSRAIEACITATSGMVENSMTMYTIRKNKVLGPDSPEVTWMQQNAKKVMAVSLPILLSRCAATESTKECISLLPD